MDDLDRRLDQVAALGEPIRRRLYRYVAAQSGPVTRHEAALGIDVAEHAAKFHLDRLVDDGLLEASYQRPPGRGGPGAGRPAKVYWRPSDDLSVTLPERRYDLAADLLARALERAARDGIAVSAAVDEVARDVGRSLGTDVRRRLGPRPSRAALLHATCDALDDLGFETRAQTSGVTLANCPFHALAREHTELVCGMNLSLLQGVVEGADIKRVAARLDPAPSRCCVRLDS